MFALWPKLPGRDVSDARFQPLHLPDPESGSDFPRFFNVFIDDVDNLHQPDLEFGDTAMHFAAKRNQLRALLSMIRKGGNPFIKNLGGETAESIVRNLRDEVPAEERTEVLNAIEGYLEKFPPKPYDSLVHSAARQNELGRLKVMKFFGANFESYNERRQLPLDVAIEAKHLELSLYLMLNTDQLFKDSDLVKRCFEFLIVQAREFSFTANLAGRYLKVFQKCFEIQKMPTVEAKANVKLIKKTLKQKLSQQDLNNFLLGVFAKHFNRQ